MGESAMVKTSDVGSLVEFTFNVSHRHHSGYIRPPRLYVVSRMCVLLSHISPTPTQFLRQTFSLQTFNIAGGKDCYVRHGLWWKHGHGRILFELQSY